MIQIKLSSIFVNNQMKALNFYTSILGFPKISDEPIGEDRWITVGHPESNLELLLEPNAHPASQTYQEAIYNDGIPATMFYVDDLETEYNSLLKKGVKFKLAPSDMGKVKIAIFDDTCGNYISLCEKTE